MLYLKTQRCNSGLANNNSAFFASLRLCVSILFVFLFLSCQSVPKFFDVKSAETKVPLDSGALVYVFADVKKARPIINLLPLEELNDKQAEQIIDRTNYFTAALFAPASGRRFQLVSRGRYPSVRAGMALGVNKSWEKRKSEKGSYWYSAANGLSLVLNSKWAYAASWLKEPDSPLANSGGTQFPQGFAEFRKVESGGQTSPFSLWLENAGPAINRQIKKMDMPFQIPAEQIFISLFPAEKKDGKTDGKKDTPQYEALIRIQLPAPAQARALAAALSFARGFLPAGKGEEFEALTILFFANLPVQNDRSLDIKTAVLGEREISLLLRMFLL